MIFDQVLGLAGDLEDMIHIKGTERVPGDEIWKDGWRSTIYVNPKFRRAHYQIIDRREDKNLLILHITVFPHFNDPSPIWGFDIVSGPNKITGAFYDFSMPGYPDHPLSKWFGQQSSQLYWQKPRELPPWAQRIFSKDMIAAGNLREGLELDDLCDAAREGLSHYINQVGSTQESLADYHQLQNTYCRYQKMNPRILDSMIALGYDEAQVRSYIENILFPEIY